jgi:hypothetical protein
MIKSKLLSILLLGVFSQLVSCKDKPGAVTSTKEASPALAAVFDAAPTSEPASIHLVRDTVKPGSQLTLKGRIMGSQHPFVEGRAAFTLGDPEKLTPCEDGCETPWDTCCDDAEDIKVGTATVQIVDESGKVLKEPLRDARGLKPLSSVIVSGVVAQGSSPENLILNASAIKVIE